MMDIISIDIQFGSLVDIKPCTIVYSNNGKRTLTEKEMKEFEWTYQFIASYIRPFKGVTSIFDLNFKHNSETVGIPMRLIEFINKYYDGKIGMINGAFCDIESYKTKAMRNLIMFCFENKVQPSELRYNMSLYSYVPVVQTVPPVVTTFGVYNESM